MAERPDVPEPLQRMLDNLQTLQGYLQRLETLQADARQAERDEAPDRVEKRKRADEYQATIEADLVPGFQSVVDIDDFLKRFTDHNPGHDSLVQKILFKKKELIRHYERVYQYKSPPFSPIQKAPQIRPERM